MSAVSTEKPRLDLSFVRRGGRTVIDRRLFAWPFVLTRSFHTDAERPDCLSVILQTGSGAVHGEDRLTQRFMLAEGAAVCVTTQGATSVHRAEPGTRAVEHVLLHVAASAALDYRPEPRILFPDAALCQVLELDCDPDAVALVTDAFTMHDPDGQGRLFRELDSTLIVRRQGQEPLLIDRMHLRYPSTALFKDRRAFGSAVLMLPPTHDRAALRLRLADAFARIDDLYAAASLLPDGAGIGVRLAAREVRQLRAGFDAIGAGVRGIDLSSRAAQAPSAAATARPTAA
ncbi:putative urease accessory protein ureD [Bradyrhizobium sp. ORS 285]|uniref:urease accessory protein UreD n=1 Tax=Bradyrhizobium sp. ORS 285 TaxID=115808 RepID=UPI00024073A7|nr:urease accessory protein UreD [Bradyrhizobium sp. ORS 285]CCD89024.1 putative urease accessory protein ureD [Bradyrhizobium sp. ORS 285]SMX58314.1 putative urease accessory protein ureD [Bradyrhizobium sp. ORS 285]